LASIATLTERHILSIADSTLGHSATLPTVTEIIGLSVADSVHVHTADNVRVTFGASLTVADSVHQHVADTVKLYIQWAIITSLLVLDQTGAANVAKNQTGISTASEEQVSMTLTTSGTEG
jgi:hypothetical protein